MALNVAFPEAFTRSFESQRGSEEKPREQKPSAMRIHLVNPSDTSFGIGVIIPRWLNRDRGKLRGSPPPTPPDMRVRIRRFGGLSNRVHSSSRNPKRVEVSVGQRDAERRRVRQPPRSEGATSRLSGQVFAHIPLA